MLPRLRHTLARYSMLPRGARVIVAVSGGPDSVALLHALGELTVVAGVAHVNHHLRAAESDADQQFVADLAATLKLPLHLASERLPAGNVEQEARRARRDFFHQLIATGVASHVATGHTRDDQAETVLMRILRGAGTAGLAGILPVTREGLIRPLLHTGRADVRAFLAERGIPWREDSSNGSLQYARNRLRLELLPQLERHWNPNLSTALAQLADLSFEEDRWLTQPGPAEFCTTGLNRAQLRRAIREAIRQAKGDLRGIDFEHVERVVEARSGSVQVPGAEVTRSLDWILARRVRPEPPVDVIAVRTPGRYPWPPASPLVYLEIDQLPCDTLELRAWRPGDQYQPHGYRRPAKLKELFQFARVPSWRRLSWPILTESGKVVWAMQFGPLDGHRVPEIRVIPVF